MKCLERDSEKKFSRTEVLVGLGVPVGTGFMALFGLPKRAINPVPTGTPSTLPTYLILVNYLSTADGIFDFSV